MLWNKLFLVPLQLLIAANALALYPKKTTVVDTKLDGGRYILSKANYY